MKTYCGAGALCKPPSNCAGNKVIELEFPAAPMLSDCTPWVPGVWLTVNPGVRAQHSMVDWLLAAEIAVMFNVDDAGEDGVDEGLALLVRDADGDPDANSVAVVRPLSATRRKIMEENRGIFMDGWISSFHGENDQLDQGMDRWFSAMATVDWNGKNIPQIQPVVFQYIYIHYYLRVPLGRSVKHGTMYYNPVLYQPISLWQSDKEPHFIYLNSACRNPGIPTNEITLKVHLHR